MQQICLSETQNFSKSRKQENVEDSATNKTSISRLSINLRDYWERLNSRIVRVGGCKGVEKSSVFRRRWEPRPYDSQQLWLLQKSFNISSRSIFFFMEWEGVLEPPSLTQVICAVDIFLGMVWGVSFFKGKTNVILNEDTETNMIALLLDK